MRILICDDDKLVIEQLNQCLNNFFYKHHSAMPEIVCYSNGESLLQDAGNKDIIFLDIEMPGIDGIYVGNHLKKQNPKTIIIVVTSYAEYLDEAMRFHVFRYLSKPIDVTRLYKNLKDALQFYNSNNTQIAIETKEGVYSISTSEIISIEAQARKVVVHTTARDYDSIHNMQFWIEKLKEPCFFQSHRSFIVNFAHIMDFNNSMIHLYNNQIVAYLTRRKYSEFKSKYLLYLESAR